MENNELIQLLNKEMSIEIIEKGSYEESKETGSNKTQQEQSFIFDWRLVFNNIRLGVRNTFHF